MEATIVIIVLRAGAGTANRFIEHWLTTYTHLTYADRTLLQRVVKAALATFVNMISLRAAGIHMASIASLAVPSVWASVLAHRKLDLT